MKFSTKAEYGLRAMASLASDFPGLKSVKDISREEKISLKYLERLMGELRKKRLVDSFKGKGGGYKLSRSPRSITIKQIIEALEGPIAFMDCESRKCAFKICQAKKVWLTLGGQVRKILQGIRLSDLIK